MGSHGARSEKDSARNIAASSRRRRLLYNMIVLKIEIRRHIERRRNPKIIIKSVIDRARVERLGVIGLGSLPEAEMPLPYAGGIVPLLPEHGSDCQPTFLYQIGRLTPQHAF